MPRRTRQQKQTKRPVTQSFRVPVHWVGGDETPAVLANQLFVRGQDGMFILSFGLTHGPYDLDPDIKALEKEGVSSKVVARVAIPPARFREFVDVLTRQLTVLEDLVGEEGTGGKSD